MTSRGDWIRTSDLMRRGDWIRTSDLMLPKHAHYQAVLHPEPQAVADA